MNNHMSPAVTAIEMPGHMIGAKVVPVLFDSKIDAPVLYALQKSVLQDLKAENLTLSSTVTNGTARMTELAQRNVVLQQANSELNNQAALTHLKEVNKEEIHPDVLLEEKNADLEDKLIKLQVDLDVSNANAELATNKAVTANLKKNKALDDCSTIKAKMATLDRHSVRVDKENRLLSAECSETALELNDASAELSKLQVEYSQLVALSSGEEQRRENFLKMRMSKFNSADTDALTSELAGVKSELATAYSDISKLLKENATLINIANDSIVDVKNAMKMTAYATEVHDQRLEVVNNGSAKLAYLAEKLQATEAESDRVNYICGLLKKVPAYEHGDCFVYLLSTGTTWLKPQYQSTEYPIYMHLDGNGYGRMLFIHEGELMTLDGNGIDFIAPAQVEPIKKSMMRFTRQDYTQRIKYGAQIALEMALASKDAPSSKERSILLSEVADYIKTSTTPKSDEFTNALAVINATCSDNQNRISMMLREKNKAKAKTKSKAKRRNGK